MYYLVKWSTTLAARLCFTFKIIGKEKLVKDGALMVCANHTSNWDAVFIAMLYPQHLHFLAKESLSKSKFMDFIMAKSKVLRVKRDGNDLSLIKDAVKVLKNNKALAIFPEGTRSKDGELQEPKAGVTMIAMKGNAVIQPVTIIRKKKLFTRVTLVVGEPMHFTKEQYPKANTELYLTLAKKVMLEIEKNMGEEI